MDWQWNSLNQYKYNSHPQRGGLHTPEAAGEAWATIIHPTYFIKHDLKEEEEERKENLNWRVGMESQGKWPVSMTCESQGFCFQTVLSDGKDWHLPTFDFK